MLCAPAQTTFLVIPWPGPRTTQFSFLVIPWLDHGTQVIYALCASTDNFLVIPWPDHGTQVINALCTSTDNFPCHPVAWAPRKRQFSWVDADHGTQVIYAVAPRHHICTLHFEKPRHKPTPTYSVHHINPANLDYIFLSNLFSNFVSTLSTAFRAE